MWQAEDVDEIEVGDGPNEDDVQEVDDALLLLEEIAEAWVRQTSYKTTFCCLFMMLCSDQRSTNMIGTH